MTQATGPLRVGIGGPVGSGKTALMEHLCKRFRHTYDIAAITNDIYTKEDARILTTAGALEAERIMGVETGGCPHTAICEDASMNLAAIAEMNQRFPQLELILIELGGDNLAATFSPELADLTIYVIDVSGGEKIPRKGGPGITRSDLLVINKVDLAPFVGASLDVMGQDAERMRRGKPFVFTNMKLAEGLDVVAHFIETSRRPGHVGGLIEAGTPDHSDNGGKVLGVMPLGREQFIKLQGGGAQRCRGAGLSGGLLGELKILAHQSRGKARPVGVVSG